MSSKVRPVMTTLYAIAGRTLFVHTLDDKAARAATSFVRDFCLDRVFTATDDPYEIRIRFSAVLPVVPDPTHRFEVAFGNCYRCEDTYYLEVEDSLVIVGPQRKKLTDVWVGGTEQARQPLALSNVLSYALESSFRRCGLYQLHAAGLVEPRSGAGVLVVGQSGSGKSTVAMMLASNGWSYLTDDALLLHREHGSVTASANRRYFAASQESLAICESVQTEQARKTPMLSDPEKYRIDPAALFPRQFVKSCVPQILLFASVDREEPTELTPLKPSDAMSRLIRSNPWTSYDHVTARDHLHTLNALVRQSKAYLLRAGKDLMQNPTLASTLLGGLTEEFNSARQQADPLIKPLR